MSEAKSREQWGSRLGVILAVAGSAVGLGNFLRFPGQAAQHGGGAFMLPYFVSLLILGIPLCWAEWTMGRFGGNRGFNSAPGVFSAIWPHWLSKYVGALALVIPLVIYMYYVMIEAWCVTYAYYYVTGDLVPHTGGAVDSIMTAIGTQSPHMSAPEVTSQAFSRFFNDFVGIAEDGKMFGAGNRHWIVILSATFLANFVLIYRGLGKGIETFCNFAMPLMLVLGVVVLVRVLTLGTPDPLRPEQSVLGGLGFMWNPNPRELLNAQTWLAASGQIFFSLSVGFGIVINYASYLRENDDVVLSGLTSSSMNEFFEVCLGGMITLPAAFIFLGAAAGKMGTFDLGFKAIPNVFALMPAGRVFGFLWFFMLFIAAITSSISMLQPVIAFLEEGFGLKRHASVAFLGLVSAIGCGYVVYFSKGLVALDTFDFWVGNVLIFMLAFFQSVLYGWLFGIERGEREAHRGAHLRIPRVIQYVLKYVAPVYLLVIFVTFCFQNLPSRDLPAFEVETQLTHRPEAGAVPQMLVDDFKKHDASLPNDCRLATLPDGAGWNIQDAQGVLLYRISNGSGRLAVRKHVPGYFETIGNDRVAFISILFIALIVVFLFVLVHIAGSRWKREGRIGPATAAH